MTDADLGRLTRSSNIASSAVLMDRNLDQVTKHRVVEDLGEMDRLLQRYADARQLIAVLERFRAECEDGTPGFEPLFEAIDEWNEDES